MSGMGQKRQLGKEMNAEVACNEDGMGMRRQSILESYQRCPADLKQLIERVSNIIAYRKRANKYLADKLCTLHEDRVRLSKQLDDLRHEERKHNLNRRFSPKLTGEIKELHVCAVQIEKEEQHWSIYDKYSQKYRGDLTTLLEDVLNHLETKKIPRTHSVSKEGHNHD